MKGIFWAGIALGAIAGAVATELSPSIKRMAKDGKQVVEDQMKNMSKM